MFATHSNLTPFKVSKISCCKFWLSSKRLASSLEYCCIKFSNSAWLIVSLVYSMMKYCPGFRE
ncbi:hypothetical protein HPHPP11_0511 [Helicobacter pylori Hp P-11]|nr:hypothetical protein HPHPP11_0511 [Helicobacter pylori Hp P-11]